MVKVSIGFGPVLKGNKSKPIKIIGFGKRKCLSDPNQTNEELVGWQPIDTFETTKEYVKKYLS